MCINAEQQLIQQSADTSANSNSIGQISGPSSSLTSTMMDVLPLILLLVMGVVISTTCGKYTSNSGSTSIAPAIDSAPINMLVDSASSSSLLPDEQNVVISNASPSQLHLVQQLGASSVESHTSSSNEKSKHRMSSLLTANNPSNRDHHHNNQHKPSHRSTGSFGDTNNDENQNNAHQSDSSYSPYASGGGGASAYSSFTYLRRVMLSNSSVTCNDGTVAGYYIRRSFGSRRWIVFLEGGWYCFSAITCHQRWLKMRSLMTSAHWPEAKTGINSQYICFALRSAAALNLSLPLTIAKACIGLTKHTIHCISIIQSYILIIFTTKITFYLQS